MGGDHCHGIQVESIEDLDLTDLAGARVRQVGVVRVDGEGDDALGIGGRVTYRVQNLGQWGSVRRRGGEDCQGGDEGGGKEPSIEVPSVKSKLS